MDWSDGESFDGLGSDVEQVSTRSHGRRHFFNDCALGLKIMECSLMKKAFNTATSEGNNFDLNVAYANEVLHFPYQESLRRSSQVVGDEYYLDWRASPSDSVNFATLLGATYRVNQGDHAKILLILESTNQHGTRESNQPHTSAHTTSIGRDVSQGQHCFEDAQQLPQYAMRLNEYAQMQEFRVSWDETILSLDPPKFRAATRVQGQNFEGIASNKKTARHLAAKKACIMLKL